MQIDAVMKEYYHLYKWYAWDFGKWVYDQSFRTKSELNKYLKGRKRCLTYVVIKCGKLVEFNRASLRPYQLYPLSSGIDKLISIFKT